MIGQKRAFSLIELLVVIGIIGILIAILLPTLSRARIASQRTACAAQLRDIGNLFQMYLNENKQRVPRVNAVPSANLLPGAPSIFEVLDPYTKFGRQGWKCPADRILSVDPGAATNHETYFDREGGSYEYNVWFNVFAFDPVTGINRVWRDILKDIEETHGHKPYYTPVFQDFHRFHGEAGAANSKNYLYADWHVGAHEVPPRRQRS